MVLDPWPEECLPARSFSLCLCMSDSSVTLCASAIIVAAGGASRMGFDKLLAPLCGEPVLLRSVRQFAACPDVAEIIIVTNEARAALLRSSDLPKISAIVPGGAQRHLSVWEGLQSSQCPLVLVHDAARPLVSPKLISACLRTAGEFGAASAAHRINETVKRTNLAGVVTESVDRTNLWAMETPQAFQRSLLLKAYEIVLRDGMTVTDEVSAVQQVGHPVRLVENAHPNIKITYPADLEWAARWLAQS